MVSGEWWKVAGKPSSNTFILVGFATVWLKGVQTSNVALPSSRVITQQLLNNGSLCSTSSIEFVQRVVQRPEIDDEEDQGD